MLKQALEFAKLKHKGQVDKANVDYFSGHILSVVANAKKLTNDEIVHIASALHDVVEDTNVKIKEIADLFGEEVAEIVQLVTKNNQTNIKEYYKEIKECEKARLVKIADLMHNSDLTRLPVIKQRDLLRNERYKNYIYYLKDI